MLVFTNMVQVQVFNARICKPVSFLDLIGGGPGLSLVTVTSSACIIEVTVNVSEFFELALWSEMLNLECLLPSRYASVRSQ